MRNFIFLLLLGVTTTGLARDVDPEDADVNIVAAAVREAGHACNSASGLKRTREGVVEGLTVWLIACDGRHYRVTFHGDTGATVVPLD